MADDPTAMKELVKKQREFFEINTTKSVAFRIEQLKKLKRLLTEHEADLNEAIFTDFKKSAFDNYSTDLGWIHHDIDEAVAKVAGWSKRKSVRTHVSNFPARSYIIAEPLGVSLIIGAWNYPYLLSLAPVVGAMAAGNTIVLKPSELPQNTSRVMAEMISKNFDPQYFAVVEGGIAETTILLDQKFDKIFFTGSVQVGKVVYQAAAQHLTPVTLELGGKSPALVSADCQLEMSVKRLIWGKFLNAGQTCIAPDYALVHKSVKAEFLELAKAEIAQEHFSTENGNYVQIINEKNTLRLVAMIDQEKLYCGGNYDVSSRHIDPTILTDISFDDEVMKEEIFGPILPVIEYENLDEAIRLIKSRPRPLACYVFTSDKNTRDKVLAEVSFGGGAVNDVMTHVTNSQLPFGGVGQSGMGAYHGEHGFRTFTHYKGILEKPTWFETSLKYFPRSERKFRWVRWILGL